MAIFFDPENADDLKLLHADVRGADELDNVVDEVEWQIIDFYSQRDMQGLSTYSDFFKWEFGAAINTDIRVRLLGYNEDDPADSDDGLKEGLRRSIATIVSYVLRNYDADVSVSSQRQGNRAVTYSGVVPTWKDWPGGWNLPLKNYDARIQQYGI